MQSHSNLDLTIGSYVKGKWTDHRYEIVDFLGEGANGKVYLVSRDDAIYAMKIGFSTFDLQSEINVLKLIEGHRSQQRYFIEADDIYIAGQLYPCYVMAYIEGMRCDLYLQKHGMEWFYIIGKQMLVALTHLHRQGWVFGDLNIHNMIVTGFGKVELIDYGGVTKRGRSVKQFTEHYDRGYWQLGTRVADDGYDLFSFAMCCLEIVGAGQHRDIYNVPESRQAEYLMSLFRAQPHCRPLLPFFERAIKGRFSSSQQACELWSQLSLKRSVNHQLMLLPIKWLRRAFIISASMLAATLYFVFQ